MPSCARSSRGTWRAKGFEISWAPGGVAGVERALSEDYALIMLDVMMPDTDGFEALRRIRQQSRIPVLMLTARGDTQDRIRGLEMGADDYLPKPFDPAELVARIRAILRRSSPQRQASAAIAIGDIELDGGSRTVRRSGMLGGSHDRGVRLTRRFDARCGEHG